MNRPTNAREALIVEALGDVARLLDRVEALTSSMDASRAALISANAELAGRLDSFQAGMESVTRKAQSKAVEHIMRRTAEAAAVSIDSQTRAMNAAARLAFFGQVDSNLARLTTALQQAIHHVDRPWELWLTHVATAVASAVLTWLVASSLVVK